MQIHNFYSDWLPATSSALDKIVLSPHTIETSASQLTGMQDDYRDFHTRVCFYDPAQLDPFMPALANHSCACHLKKCVQWFRNRHSNRKER